METSSNESRLGLLAYSLAALAIPSMLLALHNLKTFEHHFYGGIWVAHDNFKQLRQGCGTGYCRKHGIKFPWDLRNSRFVYSANLYGGTYDPYASGCNQKKSMSRHWHKEVFISPEPMESSPNVNWGDIAYWRQHILYAFQTPNELVPIFGPDTVVLGIEKILPLRGSKSGAWRGNDSELFTYM